MNKSRKRGSFLGALAFFGLFFVILCLMAVAGVFVVRDQLVLEFIREQGPKKFGLEALAINSLKTRPLGLLSFELGGVVVKASTKSPTVRAERLIVSTPNNLLALYQLWLLKSPLALNVRVEGMVVTIEQSTGAQSPTAAASEAPPPRPPDLPLAINLELDLRDASVETVNPKVTGSGAGLSIKKISGISRLQIEPTVKSGEFSIQSTGQLSMNLKTGERGELPLRAEWKANAKPKFNQFNQAKNSTSVEVEDFTVSLLGIKFKSSGKYEWPTQEIELKSNSFAADLSVIPLEPEETKALGITGKMNGELDLAMTLAGSLQKQVRASGKLKLKRFQVPISIAQKTPRPFSINGPVDAELDIPFSVLYDFPKGKIEGIDLQMAGFKIDLTSAELVVNELLNKKANVMLGLNGQLTAGGETAEISNFEFRLANFLVAAKGQVSIDKQRDSRIEFKATLPDLRGWPVILPILSRIEGSPITAEQLAQANGSISIIAAIDAPLMDPEKLKSSYKVDLQGLEIRDFSFPLGLKFLKDETANSSPQRRAATGLIQGQLQAAGNFSPKRWNVRRANGFFDLKELSLEWDEVLAKKAGRDLNLRFDANADGAKLRLDRFDVRTDVSSLSAKGTMVFGGSEDEPAISLNQEINSQIALSQLYEMVPLLRSIQAKMPTGSIYNGYKVSGTFFKKLGVEKSPLALSGKTVLRAPRLVYLESKVSKVAEDPKAQKTTAPAKDFPFLRWPVVANSQITFDSEIGTLKHKTGELKNVQTLLRLSNGDLLGTTKTSQAFGGVVDIKNIRISKLSSTPAEKIKVDVSGSFAGVNLSSLGEYFDPGFKTLVGGASNGKFQSSLMPFSNMSLLETTKASGNFSVKNGFLSTLKLDDLVNQKIAANPQVAKLLKVKPTISTKGASFDISSSYSFSKGRLLLEGMKMISPENNEIQLKGWLQQDFLADLTGMALLANTPVGGSFREANSDTKGRLMVPIRISGSLKSPSLDIAETAISAMVQRTIQHETGKAKDRVKTEVSKAVESKKKEAVDKLKEELKKRGLSF